eukprot:6212755-Pleurochrysis_carterae.AAC.1
MGRGHVVLILFVSCRRVSCILSGPPRPVAPCAPARGLFLIAHFYCSILPRALHAVLRTLQGCVDLKYPICGNLQLLQRRESSSDEILSDEEEASNEL